METILSTLSTQMADAVDRAASAVVQIRSAHWRPSTGIICGQERVLTIDRGVDDETHLAVRRPDGRTMAASLAGRDPSTGLALFRAPGLELPPAATATAVPRVGSLVIAVGRGMSGSLVAAAGLVSSVGGPLRTGRGPAIEQVMRTDIMPYAGFAGGAVVDTQGQVVGIGTAVQLRGLALVIPASIAWQVAEHLARHGRIPRGYLGIFSQPVRIPEGQRAGRDAERGLLIVGVGSDSPAARSGLLVGDLVVDFDGRPVADPEHLLTLLAGDRIGQPVPIGVLRAGTYQAVPVTIGERGSSD
jgi:S1-C subfamily serine protease